MSGAGLACLGVSAIATNVTASSIFKAHCGEGQFCIAGLYNLLMFSWEGWLFDLGTALSAMSVFVNFRERSTIEALAGQVASKDAEIADLRELQRDLKAKSDLGAVDATSLFSAILKRVFENLNLGVHERLSLYRVSEDKFYIIGRYSADSEYSKIVRRSYERGYGAIERAWKTGWCELEVKSRPKPNHGPTQRAYAAEQQRRAGVPEPVALSFRMKSRSYRALSLRDRRTGKPLAVLCLESTNPKGLAQIERSQLEDSLAWLFVVLVEALGYHIDSIETAIAEGY